MSQDSKSNSGIKSLSEIMAKLDHESKLAYSAYMEAFLEESATHSELTEEDSQKGQKPQE